MPSVNVGVGRIFTIYNEQWRPEAVRLSFLTTFLISRYVLAHLPLCTAECKTLLGLHDADMTSNAHIRVYVSSVIFYKDKIGSAG